VFDACPFLSRLTPVCVVHAHTRIDTHMQCMSACACCNILLDDSRSSSSRSSTVKEVVGNVASAPSPWCKVCVFPPFPPSTVQAADIRSEASESHKKCAYAEAIKLYEEARDMFVQVYLTVVVECCQCCRCSAAAAVRHCQVIHQGVPPASPATSDSNVCSSCAGAGEGRVKKTRKYLFYTP
jgi:hypothetical protein